MSLKVERLIGDLKENFYQLGRKEAEDFHNLEVNLKKLLSSYHLLKIWQDLLSRSHSLFKRRNQSFFELALTAYAEGLERPVADVRRVIELVEIASHYGQIRPELKALIPGCTSVFEKTVHGIFHHRLIDFPLMNFLKNKAKLYVTQFNGTTPVSWVGMSGMCLAPFHLFSGKGFSVALHQKPSPQYYAQGELIYSVLFDLMFRNETLNDLRKDLRIKSTQNKWGGYIVDKNHDVLAFDIEGPQHWFEKFSLEEKHPLIFTNTPLKYSFGDNLNEDRFVSVSAARATGAGQILKKKKNIHLADLHHLFEPRFDKEQWSIPTSTVSTQISFTYELKSGKIQTTNEEMPSIWKKSEWIALNSKEKPEALKIPWSHLTLAQGHLDQNQEDLAYHHFQMARTLCPQGHWATIIEFYLIILEYKYAQSKAELGFIYKRLLELEKTLPAHFQDHALLMKLRFEKRLKLVITSDPLQLKHPGFQKLWTKEKEASELWLQTWKNLITPRFDLLDVFYPYQ